MNESLTPAPGATFAGVYRILKSLGEHEGIASFLAEQPGSATPRTLKILAPSLVEDAALRARFEADLRAYAGVASPNVAKTLDAGVDAATGQPWLAREALKGESLASFAEGRGAITVAELADLFDQLCHGVAAIHAAGFAHQDLRPATVFLETPQEPGIAWSVRVLDLGLAPFLAQARRTPAVGDPLWMAPEQADARPPITASADVWSLGLLAFFLLVGKPYWKGASAGSMLPAAVQQEVVLDPLVAASTRAAELGVVGRIPDGFDAWFARCVARLPSERFPDARAVLEALRSTWGVRARAPLPSFSLGEDAAPAPGQSFSFNDAGGKPGPARGALPSFGFEGAGASGAPPSSPGAGSGYGPPPQGPPPGYGAGYGPPPHGPPPGYGPPPQFSGQPPNYGPSTWGTPQQPSRASSPVPWILGGLGMIVLLFIAGGAAGAYLYFKRMRPVPAITMTGTVPPASTTTEWGSIPITPQNPTWGSRVAPVTIVEFSDFQCPFCKRANATLETLKTQYGPDTLRIVWKNNPLPFHKDARPAATAAMATFEVGGSEAFWHFHDSAFAGQSALNDETFSTWAREAGVDMVRWREVVAAPSSGFTIDTDLAVGKTAGVRGTPAFFVNGVHLSGAQPLEKFMEVIEAQKTAASDAVAAGTRPEDVYVKLSKENKTSAPPPRDESAPQDEKTVWRVPIGMAPSRGPATAPVTIVEIGDFQCPFCRRAEASLGDVRARYGNKVRIVWKNNPLPFHTHAEPAAEVAIEAFMEQGDAAFWQMHDLLYENQAHLEENDLLTYAKRLHLTGAAAAISTKKHANWIKSDAAMASSLDAAGTPSFFINGRRLLGAQPVERFAKIIDEELRHAAAITARGVAPKDVYEEIQKEATVGK